MGQLMVQESDDDMTIARGEYVHHGERFRGLLILAVKNDIGPNSNR